MSSSKDSYEDKYNKLVELHNMLDLENLIGSTYKLDQINDAILDLRNGTASGRLMITF